jgi:lysophospholipase L1-like esterase
MRARRLGIVVLGVVVAAATAEAVLRLARFGVTSRALARWSDASPWEQIRIFDAAGDPLPRAGGRGTWSLAPGEPPIVYQLNAAGLRAAADVPARPPPGVCRVLALGDAYTFGYGVRADEAYPAVLARQLAAVGRFEVLNAGFPNVHVEQQRRRLRTLLDRLAPDVVLVNFDWWNVPPAAARPVPARWSGAWVIANLEQKTARLGAWLGIIERGLAFARRAFTPTVFAASGMARELEPLVLPPEQIAARWERTETTLAGMAADAAAAGASFALVLTPLDLEVDPARNTLYRDGTLPYPSHGFVDIDYTRATHLRRALRRFARAQGISLLDTTPAFRARRGTPLFLSADYHAGPAGHRLIARQTARWIQRARPCAARGGLAGAELAERDVDIRKQRSLGHEGS